MAASHRFILVAIFGLLGPVIWSVVAGPTTPAPEIGSEREFFASICEDKRGTKFTHLSQFRRFASSVGAIKRCANYVEPIKQLDAVVAMARAGDTCTMDFIRATKPLHLRYVMQENGHKFRMPLAVRRLFMVIVYQASALCKIELIEKLESSVKGRVDAEDFRLVEPVMDFSSKVLHISPQVDDVGDIALISDFLEEYGSGFMVGDRECMAARVPNSLEMNTAALMCANKFKPIYDHLILPLVHLADMGYDFNAGQASNYYTAFQRLHEPQFRQWFSISQACEVADRVKAVQEGDSKLKSKGKVTMIQQREYEKLSKKDPALAEAASKAPPMSDFKAGRVRIPDELWIQDQTEIERRLLGEEAEKQHYHQHHQHLYALMDGAMHLLHNPFHNKRNP